jgi:hypothetical protein
MRMPRSARLGNGEPFPPTRARYSGRKGGPDRLHRRITHAIKPHYLDDSLSSSGKLGFSSTAGASGPQAGPIHNDCGENRNSIPDPQNRKLAINAVAISPAKSAPIAIAAATMRLAEISLTSSSPSWPAYWPESSASLPARLRIPHRPHDPSSDAWVVLSLSRCLPTHCGVLPGFVISSLVIRI